MSRSDQVYLQDIFESVIIVLDYIEHKTEFDFVNDMMLQDAVTRRFEIIGEAASQISIGFKNSNPNVPWRLMKEMRNKLIHEYFGVSPITVYSTATLDLPILKQELDKLIK